MMSGPTDAGCAVASVEIDRQPIPAVMAKVFLFIPFPLSLQLLHA